MYIPFIYSNIPAASTYRVYIYISADTTFHMILQWDLFTGKHDFTMGFVHR